MSRAFGAPESLTDAQAAIVAERLAYAAECFRDLRGRQRDAVACERVRCAVMGAFDVEE